MRRQAATGPVKARKLVDVRCGTCSTFLATIMWAPPIDGLPEFTVEHSPSSRRSAAADEHGIPVAVYDATYGIGTLVEPVVEMLDALGRIDRGDQVAAWCPRHGMLVGEIDDAIGEALVGLRRVVLKLTERWEPGEA